MRHHVDRLLPYYAHPFIALPRWQILLSFIGFARPVSLATGRNHPYTLPALPSLLMLAAEWLGQVLMVALAPPDPVAFQGAPRPDWMLDVSTLHEFWQSGRLLALLAPAPALPLLQRTLGPLPAPAAHDGKFLLWIMATGDGWGTAVSKRSMGPMDGGAVGGGTATKAAPASMRRNDLVRAAMSVLPYTPQRFQCGPRYGEGHPQLVAFFCHLPRIDQLPREVHARIYRERPNLVRELDVPPTLQVPWTCCVVKRFGWRGVQHYLLSPLKRARAMKAYRTACHLLAHGLSTPLPLGVFAERRWGFVQYNVYVTEALRDAMPLSRYRTALPEGEAGLEEVLQLAATYTRRMHDSGLWHRDMVLPNFLVAGTLGQQQLSLVDLNRARRLPYMPVWLRAIDLARMDWREAQARFCALYCGERFSTTYVLRMIRLYHTWRTWRRWWLRGAKALRQRLTHVH